MRIWLYMLAHLLREWLHRERVTVAFVDNAVHRLEDEQMLNSPSNPVFVLFNACNCLRR